MAKLYTFTSLDSTNLKAKELAVADAPAGTLIWAKRQTAGRGRLGKSWHSQANGGLYCSLILRPRVELGELAKTTMVCGAALAALLKERTGKEVGLKWPNDIFFGGRKCAGILVESSPLRADKTPFVIVGVGLNVNQRTTDFPPELRELATSLFLESGREWPLEELLAAVKNTLIKAMAAFEARGFAETLLLWRGMDLFFGQEMEAVDPQGRIIRGVSLGPDEEGVLRLRSATGELVTVLSGDVRLAHQTKAPEGGPQEGELSPE